MLSICITHGLESKGYFLFGEMMMMIPCLFEDWATFSSLIITQGRMLCMFVLELKLQYLVTSSECYMHQFLSIAKF